MPFYKCSYCEVSLRTNEERKDHEEICVKNGKTEKERFEARQRQAGKKENRFYIVPQTDEEIEKNRKIIEELRARGVLQKYEKTFKLNEDGTATQED